MGIVYLASDTLLDREIALKVVHEELVGEQGERLAALFQQEARNLAGLNHPGIVQIFDYSGLYSKRLYLVMEYVPGQNLGTLLSMAGPLPPMLVVHLGTAVSGVLAYAHQHRLIHQDLKPENILLTTDGRIKLTDFGISQHLAKTSGNPLGGAVAGTPAFMAPEQAMGLPVDMRSDIFSLGATLYMLATGKTLLEGNSPTETVAAIARGDFPSVLDRRPNLPSGLARIITRALAITPDDRYPDVASLGAALAELAGVPAPKADDIPRVPADLIPARAHPDKPGPGPPSDVAAFAA
ncbi:MAG: serine/threonine protein kinase, partial [Myxococcota bacterium]